MHRIAIVDDESIFREYLRTTIDWNSYGFEIGLEARNGVEALDLMDKNRMDIALVDINMPYMDGLELSQKLKEKHPEMPVVLITGHSEFEYARRAVKLGVVDYILKPFEKEELILTLLRIKGSLQKAQEEKHAVRDSMELLKERTLNRLLHYGAQLNPREVEAQLQKFGITPESRVLRVFCIEIDQMEQRWDNADEINLWKFAVSNVLSEVVKIEGNHIVFDGPEGRILSIVEFRDAQKADILRIEDSYRRLCGLIKKVLGFTITVGAGNRCSGYENLRNSYNQAAVALQNKFVLGNDRVITYSELGAESAGMGFYPGEIHEDLLINLRLGNRERLEEKLRDVFEYIRDRKLSIDYTYAVYMGLVSICLSFVVESGSSIEELFGKNFLPLEEVKKRESVEALHRWITELFGKILEHSRCGRMTRARKITESAKEYIDTNYMDNELTVEDIARSLYINSGYLRQIFKKEAGMTVTDYITNTRMKKARELLNSGNIKLCEISSMVGYSDASYFSKCFKKYYGRSPSEYENMSK